uniref:Homeobox domain-containing protein n=1 Tax=Timema shepardi TaxID=629360 RepID=A0A7R9AVC2_TIMSH|nr:unnamed protein product [Timema shepardi]
MDQGESLILSGFPRFESQPGRNDGQPLQRRDVVVSMYHVGGGGVVSVHNTHRSVTGELQGGTTPPSLSLFPGTDVPWRDSSESGSHKGRESGRSGGSNKTSGDGKPTRVRTVLNEKQLHTLRTCYNANPRPDALMKEQLVEMTQLSPRVIRVWFQNKRCKDKKKAILMKQQMQQEKVRPHLHPRILVTT